MTVMTPPTRPMNDPLTSAYPVLDAARLSELVEAEVCAGGLRHKPGRSTSASLLSRSTGRPLGWVQILLGHQPEKVANARRRASARGRDVRVRDLPDVAGVLVHGPIDTDPRLHRGLATIAPVLPDLVAAIADGAVEVLRYNALRRLVLRGGDLDTSGHLQPGQPWGVAQPGRGLVDGVPATEVVRVSAVRRGPGLRAAAELAARGLPVGAAVLDPVTPTSRYVTVWPWVEGVDLAHAPDPDAAAAAAHALAGVHIVADSVGGQRIQRMLTPGDPPQHRVARIVTDALAVAPELAGRMLSVIERLPEPAWDTGHIVHGDFSADQVIRRAAAPQDTGAGAGSADITIIDLDRVRLGDPHEDLGCFAAAELRRTGGWGLLPHLVEAYPRPVRRGSLHAWTLHALVMRVLEPFRSASPDWRNEISARFDEIEHVLTDGVLT